MLAALLVASKAAAAIHAKVTAMCNNSLGSFNIAATAAAAAAAATNAITAAICVDSITSRSIIPRHELSAAAHHCVARYIKQHQSHQSARSRCRIQTFEGSKLLLCEHIFTTCYVALAV
jgi:hypothetical protein